MTSQNFAYWLQGFFEIAGASGDNLNASQTALVKRHLSLVFAHEIDPSAGDASHQAKLDVIHHQGKDKSDPPGGYEDGVLVRC